MTITWQIKAIIAAAIAVLIGLMVWFGVHEYHTVLKDQKTIGTQSQVINDQKNTIQQQHNTAVVTDNVVASSVQADQNAVTTNNKIDTWVQDQTKDIDNKYTNPTSTVVTPTPSGGKPVVTKPVTPPAPVVMVPSDKAGDVVPTGREAEVSAVQLTGSWMKYCAAVGNDDPKCAGLPQPQ